jgi:hypothetical protein
VIECDVHRLVISQLSAHFNMKASLYAKHDVKNYDSNEIISSLPRPHVW